MLTILRLFIFPFLFNGVYSVDPLLSNLIQLTFSGDNSYPSFSSDGRSIFFTSKNGPYSKCEHVYRMDRHTNSVSLFSSGFGREFNSVRIGDRYAILSTALKDLANLVNNADSSEVEADMFCPEPKCKSQGNEDSREACSRPHLERLLGSTVLRLLDSGILTDLNDKIDFENGWVSNEAWNGENQSNFARVFSQNCDLGECITIEDKNGLMVVSDSLGWWDGFTNYKGDGLAYSGTSIAEFELEDIKLGVIPLNGSKIYNTTFSGLKNQKPTPIIADSNFAFLYPSFDPTNGDIISTRVSLKDGSSILVKLKSTGEVQEMTTNRSDYFQGSVSQDGQEIVFISNMNGDGNQVYLGSLVDPRLKTFPAKPFISVSSPTKYFYDTRAFSNMANNEVSIKPKFSHDGNFIMYGMTNTENSCNQIFQLNMKYNDTSIPRKMTTGMHYFESPNFFGPNGDILYAGTLTREVEPKNIDLTCKTRHCYATSDPILKKLCQFVGIEKGLPKESDIYIANQYGHVKKRLTKGNLYDGEPSVSSDFQLVVFSRETEDDYELHLMNINGTDMKQLTYTLGYEGGAVFSPNMKYIAFYAYRPTQTNEIERFAKMKEYGFTDLKHTHLYVYNLETNTETLVSSSCVRCYSPAFLPTNDWLVFINELDSDKRLLMAMDLRTLDGNMGHKVIQLDTLTDKIADLSFNRDSVVYSTHSAENKYEITLGKFFTISSANSKNLSAIFACFSLWVIYL